MQIKLMTYNIQHCLDYLEILNNKRVINIEKIVNVIKSENPDIIVLNEVYSEGLTEEFSNQTKIICDEAGYENYFFGKSLDLKGGEFGNSIISRYPLKNIKVHKVEDPIIHDEDVYYESRIIIEAKVIINKKSISLFASHFGLAKSEQKNATDLLLKLVKNKKNIVFMGDLNMTSDNDNIKEISKRLFNTELLSKEKYKTFPSVNPLVKIDHIFTSKSFSHEYMRVVNVVASDHFPVVLKMDM